MNTTMRMGWLAIVLGATLCGCASRPQSAEPAARAETPNEIQPIVKSAIAGMVRVPPAHRGEGIEINVAGDQKATDALRARLSSVGYRVVAPGEAARYRLRIAPTYMGPDAERPIVGTAEANPHKDYSTFFAVALPSMDAPTIAVAPPAIKGVVSLISMAMRLGRIQQASATLPRRPDPVDALVMRMVLADGQRIEEAEILTQSYADKVPMELMVQDNIKTLVWLLE